ncbi:MAG: AAA family ATPase [Verrucomicrobiota bacterium]|nr:AAA family ATPase [Verrucomicrobiota bacterium]
MYLEYYGLREMPFNITPDPRFLFLSPKHQEALQHLRYGIQEKKGFMVLTGEVGCGKTLLCRKLMDEMNHDRYATALILNPRLNEFELVQVILSELGEGDVKGTMSELLARLNRRLLELIQQGKDIVLIIDESQNLEVQTMEHLRLLSNLETDKQKLLQIILIGQPELKDKLERKDLRQLLQRVLVFYELEPLDLQETTLYIQHRLTMAGSAGRPRFSRNACKKIFSTSLGIPRVINNLCDKAVLAAYVKNRDEVTWWDVRRAKKELSVR